MSDASGISTLVAVAVGGGLAFASTFAVEVWRYRSARQDRRDAAEEAQRKANLERSLSAYVAMLTSANLLYAKCRESATTNDAVRRVELSREVEAARENLTITMSPAFLVTANDELRRSLALILRRARELADLVPSAGPGNLQAIDSALSAHREAVIAAETLIRTGAGI